MTSVFFSVAVAVVRGWVRLYTCRLPAAVRERRLAEIESDLWEFQRDVSHAPGVNPALHVLLRLVAGAPDDLRWRLEHAAGQRRSRRATLAVVATAMLVMAVWVFTSSTAATPPEMPAAAPLRWPPRPMPAPPPPPPPPPPPCTVLPTADCSR